MFQILQQTTSGSKLGVLLPNMAMAVTWHQNAWGPWICILPERHHSRIPCSKVCIKESSRPVLQDRVSDCTFTRRKHPDCFLILHVRKIYFEGLFLIFLGVHVTHWMLCPTDEINKIFNHSSVIYMRAQVNSITIANICWLIQIFKYQCCGFQVHFKSISVYNLKTKSQNIHIT